MNCKNISILRIFFKMRSSNYRTFPSEKIFISFLKCEDHEFCFSVSCAIFVYSMCIFWQNILFIFSSDFHEMPQ